MEIKTLAITQARMSSTRLPGKVLMEINQQSLLELHIKRMQKSLLVDRHVIAISDHPNDDVLEAYCRQHNINFYRGSENDVLDRFYKLAEGIKPATIVRLTADCPLIDAGVVDETISLYQSSGVDYASNTLEPSYPDGMDVEVFSFSALQKAWTEASLRSDREHVTPYIWRNSSEKGGTPFSSKNKAFEKDYSRYRLTVDEKEDFMLVDKLVNALGHNRRWLDYVNWMEENKVSINDKFLRNEGYINSLNKD